MAVNLQQIQQAVEAENERLNKIDVEKVRVRLEEVSRLKKAKQASIDNYDRQIAQLQKEVAELQFNNEVSLQDIAPGA